MRTTKMPDWVRGQKAHPAISILTVAVRGLGPPDRGHEQDRWPHGGDRKPVPEHIVDLRSW